jgi:hypothetical protein
MPIARMEFRQFMTRPMQQTSGDLQSSTTPITQLVEFSSRYGTAQPPTNGAQAAFKAGPEPLGSNCPYVTQQPLD